MELPITADYWKKIVGGVALMIASSLLASLQTSVVKWGSQLGYIASVILIIRGGFQFVLCIAESVFQPNLHIVKDIKSIGIVPKRTLLPIFERRAHLSTNYGSFQSVSSVSKLSDNIHDSKNASTSNCNLNVNGSAQSNTRSFFYIIWSAVILRGLFGGVATLLKFQAFILLPVGDVLSLVACSAIFTPFLAFLFFNDRISSSHIISLLGAIAGVVLIVQPPFIFSNAKNPENSGSGNDDSAYGYLYIICAALVQSLVYICIQFARKVPVYILILSQSIWCMITGFVVLLIAINNTHGEFTRVLWLNSDVDIAYIVILGVTGYLALWCLTKSGQFISSGIIALLSNLSIVWGYLLQCLVFKELPSWITLCGAALMLLSAVIVSVEKIRDARKKSMSVIQRNIATNNANI